MAEAPQATTAADSSELQCLVRVDSRQVVVQPLTQVGPDAERHLHAMLSGLVDDGAHDVVVDMVDHDSLDAPGLWVLARVSAVLRRSGGILTLRSASRSVRDILEITALSDYLPIEAAPPDARNLGTVAAMPAGVDIEGEAVARRLRDALLMRETIAQAQGILMAREGLTAAGAYSELRRSSKHSGTGIRDRAAEIVASAERGSTPSRGAG